MFGTLSDRSRCGLHLFHVSLSAIFVSSVHPLLLTRIPLPEPNCPIDYWQENRWQETRRHVAWCARPRTCCDLRTSPVCGGLHFVCLGSWFRCAAESSATLVSNPPNRQSLADRISRHGAFVVAELRCHDRLLIRLVWRYDFGHDSDDETVS